MLYKSLKYSVVAYLLLISYFVFALLVFLPLLPEERVGVLDYLDSVFNPELSFLDGIVAMTPIILLEELLYRVVPLFLFFLVSARRQGVYLLGIIGSALFGYFHSFTIGGVLVQGVGGFILFCLAYEVAKPHLKNGSSLRVALSLLVCPFLVHLSFNSTLLAYMKWA